LFGSDNMSLDDLKKMGSHLQNKKAPSRFQESAMPNNKLTFSRDNFKRNTGRVIGAMQKGRSKLQTFGDKHPNLRDPSWMLSDDPFGTKPRPQQQHHKKHKHHPSGGTHIHIHYR